MLGHIRRSIPIGGSISRILNRRLAFGIRHDDFEIRTALMERPSLLLFLHDSILVSMLRSLQGIPRRFSLNSILRLV